MSPLLFLAALHGASAQEVQIQIDPRAAETAGVNPAQAEAALQTTADATLKVSEQLDFMDQMARANALATRGLGVDYASNIDTFVVGFGFGSAVNAAGLQFGRGDLEVPEGGFAGAMSLMAGLNLGMGAAEDSFARRFRLFAHGMYAQPDYDPFSSTIVNYGGHLQIQLARPREGPSVEWGGLALTSGYQATTFTMDLASPIPVESGSLRWDADGTYAISSVAQSVPVELSTNLRIFLVTAYAGGGVDANLESAADSEMVLEGDIEAGDSGRVIGSARVTQTEAGLGDLIVPRIFAGAQLNLFFVRVYGQLNVGFNESVGGHLGVRAAL